MKKKKKIAARRKTLIPVRKKRVREVSVERYLVQQGRLIGIEFRKLVMPGFTGAPDRIGNIGKGRAMYVEAKTKAGKLSPRQIRAQNELLAEGAIVCNVYTRADVDSILDFHLAQ